MSQIKNLFFKRKDFQLRVSNLNILDKGITWLQGPNGSGKSTLVLALSGLLDPQPEFTWIFKNEDIAKWPAYKRGLSVVFQKSQVFSHMSVQENILLPLETKIWKKAPWPLEQIYDLLSLESLLNKKAFQLSGGELKKLALARAFSVFPRMFILDEPFSFLDTDTRENFKDFLKKTVQKTEIPILLISHDYDFLKRDFETQIFYIKSGEIS